MRLDIRIPIGLLFAIVGLLLILHGTLSDPALYQRSLGINVNFWWGIVMAAFGGAMLLLSRRMRSGSASDGRKDPR